MNPYQLVPSRWPKKVKDKCFDLYMQGYTAPEIQQKTRVPPDTLYGWARGEWSQIRKEMVTDYTERANLMYSGALQTAGKLLKTSSKVLDHINTRVDDQNASEDCKNSSQLKPDEIESLSNAMLNCSEVLFRLFGK